MSNTFCCKECKSNERTTEEYFPIKRNGERYTRCTQCVKRGRERVKKFDQEHREHKKEYGKAYYQEHKEQMNENRKASYRKKKQIKSLNEKILPFRERKCKWCMKTFTGGKTDWQICSDCNECEAKVCEADYLKSLNRSNKNLIDPFSD